MITFTEFTKKEQLVEAKPVSKATPLKESNDRNMDDLLSDLRELLSDAYDDKSIKHMDWSEVPTKNIVDIKKSIRTLLKHLE